MPRCARDGYDGTVTPHPKGHPGKKFCSVRCRKKQNDADRYVAARNVRRREQRQLATVA
jgi:hypothetical protein